MIFTGSCSKILISAGIFICLLLGNQGLCDKVHLSAGSKIKIHYKKQISTNSDLIPSINDLLEIVSGDTIAGIEVFRRGGNVYGEVVQFKKPGRLGKPGFVQIRIDSVEAIGGKKIAVMPVQLSDEGKRKKLKACLLCPLLGFGYFIKGGHAVLGDDREKIIIVRTAKFEEIYF